MTMSRTVLADLLYALVCATPASSAEQEIDFRPGYPNLCEVDGRDWKVWRDGFEKKFPPGADAADVLQFADSLVARGAAKHEMGPFGQARVVAYTYMVRCPLDGSKSSTPEPDWDWWGYGVDRWAIILIVDGTGKLISANKGEPASWLRYLPDPATVGSRIAFDIDLFFGNDSLKRSLREILKTHNDISYIDKLMKDSGASIDIYTHKIGIEHVYRKKIRITLAPISWLVIFEIDNSGKIVVK